MRVQLNLGVNVMEAQQDVQAKVARIRRQLPRDIDDPVIVRFDPNERPIMSIAIQSRRPPAPRADRHRRGDHRAAARGDLRGRRRESSWAGSTRQIRVQLDHATPCARTRSARRRSRPRCERENQEVPAGRVTSGQIRAPGARHRPHRGPHGVPRHRRRRARRRADPAVATSATVVDGAADQRSAARYNGDPAVALDMLKISGANTVEVADAVRVVVDELRPADAARHQARGHPRRLASHPRIAERRAAHDPARRGPDDRHHLPVPELVALDGHHGAHAAVSIISAFFIMWVFGFTVNTMTLLALSLAIGLLIDDAIVVRENIVRHIEMGKDHHRAAKEGTDEIGLAVISTTLAVVAVFIPVAFMGGMIGKIFFQFGVTVAFAVLVSLFVSFTLDPMLSSVWARSGGRARRATPTARARRRVESRFAASRSGFNDRFERIADRYPRWLDWALDAPADDHGRRGGVHRRARS